jgi:hypothetical protein
MKEERLYISLIENNKIFFVTLYSIDVIGYITLLPIPLDEVNELLTLLEREFDHYCQESNID